MGALATLRRAQGQLPEVESLVAKVSAICESLGARRTLARASLLSDESARMPPAARPELLTGREVEVPTLIATGISNQEIAERLVLSVRAPAHGARDFAELPTLGLRSW